MWLNGSVGNKLGFLVSGVLAAVFVLAAVLLGDLELLANSRLYLVVAAALLLLLVIAATILGSYHVVARPLQDMQRFAGKMGTEQQLPAALLAQSDEVGSLARQLTDANSALLIQKQEIDTRARQLEQESNSDSLTGLYNRKYLFSEGTRLYERWQRDGAGIALLMIDIDRLKLTNDKYGHQTGDDVLATVAQILKQQCRPYDLVARYGGEEFVVMLEASSYGSGNTSAQRILQSIAENVFWSGEIALHITVSIGVVEGSSLGDFDSTLHKVDEALNQAKDAGGNRIVIHSEAL